MKFGDKPRPRNKDLEHSNDSKPFSDNKVVCYAVMRINKI